MTDLLDWAPPDGVEVLRVWLAPLAECRTERPAGAVLPFIMVRRTGGGDDGLTDTGRYQVSVFDETEVKAMAFSATVHRRVRLLAGRFAGPQAVALPGGDVHADDLRTIESFRPEPYGAEPTVYRVRAVYEAHLRLSAA
ncbi:hypothetical protein [Mycolicibacterium fluoranthenivorans]|uniref:DUF3168 domain-containing protein n=1 Tax=Mycolicibacterium fluoranthenivorans TaxID=258505 RepID=A0A7X5ZD42_9MYCO|nr:hypothetical protein [Mycolicibacterium fluoranthenivorans]MCV7358165.1 hypothetical protein [Mycolicibacterium fluoranthenivorans]NIH95712.1 hypothetical protein [Mycolicibacterium fluoranthenivorans]